MRDFLLCIVTVRSVKPIRTQHLLAWLRKNVEDFVPKQDTSLSRCLTVVQLACFIEIVFPDESNTTVIRQ